MSTDSVTPNRTTTASSHEALQASAPIPQVGEGTRAHAADLRRRLIVSAPLGILAMLLSMVPAWQFTGWQWVVAVASIPVVTWGAWPFHRAAFAAGRHGSTTMDTLVSLGVISSTLWSWWALLWGGAGMLGMRMHMSLIPRAAHAGHAEIYFEGACMIVVFLLTGRYLEARARYRAGDALRSLLSMGAKEATLVRIDPETGERTESVVPASSLQVGDLFAVRPGEKVATDGIIVEGSSALDTSLLTGESVPVDAAPGDTVTGATVNTWGSLLVRATRVGSDTTLAQIGRMVAEAQAGKAPVQRLADQISGVFVPIVIAVSLLTLIGWLLAGGSVQAAFTAAVAVLVVACPCALGLATPTAILVGSGRASQLGILIKNAEILEQTRSIDTMLLDKTGTVTTGVMSLESVAAASAGDSPEVDEASALALAASVESLSEHPVARAITSGATDRGLSLEPVTAFANQPGLGVVGLTARGGVLVGRPSWLASLGIDVPASLLDAVREAEASGASAVVAAIDLGIKARTPWQLAERGVRVHVLPPSATFDEVLALSPDGVFFSNGPGDPGTATSEVELLRGVLDARIPFFGICLGNQILGRALGYGTYKLAYGHRGVNQPVLDRATGRVEITAHNHGFAVDAPADAPSVAPYDDGRYGRVEVSHTDLNDGVVEGLRALDLPAFSVQYHPEAAAGPHDGEHLFDRFIRLMRENREATATDPTAAPTAPAGEEN